MGFDLNSLAVTGNVGRDPERRSTPNGKEFTRFALAVTGYGDKTTWLNCTAWGKLGEQVANIVNKGAKLAVQGELEVREYEKDGAKRTAVGVNVRGFTVCSWPKVRDGGGGSGSGDYGRPADAHPNAPGGGMDAGPPPDDNYPF